MRSRSVVSALLVLTAGAVASVVARRLAGRRRSVAAAPVAAAPVATPVVETIPAPSTDAVVLPFTRPSAPVPAQPAAPARCGENGGRTKAGAPCAARAASGGRCHHHRRAA